VCTACARQALETSVQVPIGLGKVGACSCLSAPILVTSLTGQTGRTAERGELTLVGSVWQILTILLVLGMTLSERFRSRRV